MSLVANIPVDPNMLFGVLGVLGFLLTAAVQIMTLVRGRNPQPFAVRHDAGYVDRNSYHKHAEINRDEHRRIETELGADIKNLDDKHNALAREVSDVTATARATDARLAQMDRKLDSLLKIAGKQS